MKPWQIDGPQRGPDPPGIADALRRLHEGRSGPPLESDRPSPSIFPITRAAREALRLTYGGVSPSRRFPMSP